MTRKRNTPPGPDLVVTSIRIERDTWERFQRAAAASTRSASQELRRLVNERVEAHESELAEAA